jgi:hypothetical protein
MECQAVSHRSDVMMDSGREAARRYREKAQAMAQWHRSSESSARPETHAPRPELQARKPKGPRGQAVD